MPRTTGRRKLLEIGPGIGLLVPTLLAAQWEITLIESDPWAATYLHHAFPSVQVITGCFPEVVANWYQRFDAILALHVLEHLPAADVALERLWGLLADRGLIAIEVPDQADLYVQDHWWHFAEKTLEKWLAAAGAGEIKHRVVPGDGKHVWFYQYRARRT